MAKPRTIALDEKTADALEARAQARGVSVTELVGDLLQDDAQILGEGDPWPEWAEKMRAEGRGPWSAEILAEDAERWAEYKRTGMAIPLEDVEAWANSLGTANELPPPKPRKT